MTANTSQRYTFKSSVAIDLNADVTGIFLTNFEEGELPSSANSSSACIVAPKSDADLIFSSASRTARRHVTRSKKRFKMARRLLDLCVTHYLEQIPDAYTGENLKALMRELHGYLKRRGFSRLESEIDLALLDDLEAEVFAAYPALETFFHAGALAYQYEALMSDKTSVEALNKALPTDKEFRIFLKSHFKELSDQHRLFLEALRVMRDDSYAIHTQFNTGHQHRSAYLSAIFTDMTHSKRLVALANAMGGIDRLWCLIGNISNLQLRSLRWYFEDIEMKDGDLFKPEKLKRILIRHFQYFHPADAEDKKRLDDLVTLFNQSQDILATLSELNPEHTIPPYEDQNNRKPPVDQTLLLNPRVLNERYGNRWRLWAKNFVKADPDLGSLLDEVLSRPDRRTRAFGDSSLDDKVYRDSYILQRVLDRSAAHDPYAIRARVRGKHSQALVKAEQWMNTVLGSQHVKDFLSFATDYYEECDRARAGLWLKSPANLLERSDIHPPLKKNVLALLVGNVFGLSPEFGQAFIDTIWTMPLVDRARSTIRSACAGIVKVRDELGTSFHWRYRQVSRLVDKGDPVEAEDKELKKVCLAVELVYQTLCHVPSFTAELAARVANPYSLCQLYDLIETNRSGFTSNVLAVHTENLWRSSMVFSDRLGKMAANAVRLPADSVRPFDGVMAKFLTRNAHEIANLLVKELKTQCSRPGADIDLSFLLRQNVYRFSASLSKMKGNNVNAKKLTEASERQEARWEAARRRVTESCCGLCPYTGKALALPVIDHILPMDLLNDDMSNVFNQEVNLLLVSPEGKLKKGQLRYRLNDLHPDYLKEMFNTSDLDAVERGIEREVLALEGVKRLSRFDALSDSEQDCVRHALFLEDTSPARQLVLRYLSRSKQINLEGTQAWFIRTLFLMVQERLDQWCTENNHRLFWHSFQCSARESNGIVNRLGELDSRFAHKDVPTLSDYAINALAAYAASCAYKPIVKATGAYGGLADVENADNAKMLLDLIPASTPIIHIKRKETCEKDNLFSAQVFKDSILGERFLPIMVRAGHVYIGFTCPNKEGLGGNGFLVEGKHPEQLLKDLNFVLEKPYEPTASKPTTYRIDKQKAFAFFSRVVLNQKNATEEDLQRFELLNSLLYFVRRVNVFDQLTVDGKKFAKKDEVFNDKNFAIPVKFKCKAYSLYGCLTMPDRVEWEHLIEEPALQECWGEALDTVDLDLNAWLTDRFGLNKETRRQHKPVRTTVGLPMRAKADGGFRIRRRTAEGDWVYQLYSINGAKYMGFMMSEEGVVNWKEPVVFPSLVNESLTPLELNCPEAQRIAKMTDYRTVQEGDITVRLAPGTKSRRFVEVEMSFARFKHWIRNEPNAEEITSSSMLHTTMKLANAKAFVEIARKDTPFIGAPQTFLVFTKIGQTIAFRCSIGSSSIMTEAYNKSI